MVDLLLEDPGRGIDVDGGVLGPVLVPVEILSSLVLLLYHQVISIC